MSNEINAGSSLEQKHTSEESVSLMKLCLRSELEVLIVGVVIEILRLIAMLN